MARKRSEETRERITDAAVSLFARKGYAQTTMREIAKEAQVSVGASYYYFNSKEAIVLEFYVRTQGKLDEQASEIFAETRDLKERVSRLIRFQMEFFAPYRDFFRILAAASADPDNELSPFSERTAEIREKSIAVYERALDGCKQKIPDDLRPHLPRLLWLYHMGLVLFWLWDNSREFKRTDLLLNGSIALVIKLLEASRLPLMKTMRKSMVSLLGDLFEDGNSKEK